ncbi:GIY-YIG nuclease family protein [Candidatus Omnitrophota bacterium]
MYIVYILKSLKDPTRSYIGLTQNLKRRLEEHNSEKSNYAQRYAPWEVETYINFRSRLLAERFEKYLKAGSGQTFLKRHFLPPLAKQNGV